jgi:hypothetical protein
VFSNPDNYNCSQTSAGTSCNVTGLTNGTAYTFRVLGNNGTVFGGTGFTASATPATPPGAPTSPNAAVDTNGTVTLTWTAPANNGGSAITGYTVTVGGGPGACTVTGAQTTCTGTGLTFATPYTFNISAVNATGTGPFVQVEATPIGRPTQPTAVQLAGLSGTGIVTVSWTAPNNSRGSAITGSTVLRSAGTLAAATTHCTAAAAAVICANTTALTPGSYRWWVTANNARGTSDTSVSVSGAVVGLAGVAAQGHFGFQGENTFRVAASLVPELEKVFIRVTNMKGQTLWNRSIYPARDQVQSITWNADNGFRASVGTYMVHAEVTAVSGQVHVMSRKMTSLK